MSKLSGFTLPGDVSASARYWEEDIIEPLVVVCPKGRITPPANPGIGFEIKENFIETLAVKRESLSLT